MNFVSDGSGKGGATSPRFNSTVSAVRMGHQRERRTRPRDRWPRREYRALRSRRDRRRMGTVCPATRVRQPANSDARRRDTRTRYSDSCGSRHIGQYARPVPASVVLSSTVLNRCCDLRFRSVQSVECADLSPSVLQSWHRGRVLTRDPSGHTAGRSSCRSAVPRPNGPSERGIRRINPPKPWSTGPRCAHSPRSMRNRSS
jgi:hypothetical protein